VDLPAWADSLVSQHRAGNLAADREELLTAVVKAELAALTHSLSQ
jgi:hypothetical protein